MTATELKARVQAYLNDKAAGNRLLGYQDEYTLEDVINCANMALEEINYKGIYTTSFTMESCDPYLLRLGTAKYLLSASIAQKSRNTLTVNDGGVAVNREGNIDHYYRLYDMINAEFDDQVYSKKNAASLLRGFGH